MVATSGRNGMRLAAVLTLACTGLAAAGCSSASGSVASGARPRDGAAIVATSGSLQYLNDTTLGRAFTKATGYRYRARSADTLAAAGPTGRSLPNVVESVGTQPFGVHGRRLSSWYVQYAATSMVIAYNPETKYGAQLAAIAHNPKLLPRLFPLLAQPGLRLGRPAPGFDPQGTAFIAMLELAQRQYGFPASLIPKILRGPVTATTGPQIFNPYTLVHRLQAGQLDAIAAYRSEVVQLHLRYIPLPPAINLGDPSPSRRQLYGSVSVPLADGTVAHGEPLVINISTVGKPSAAAQAFVTFVLSAGGLALHYQGGFRITSITAFGDRGAIPAAIRNELGQT
jgi:molybdate/tungstate transport system substrate-binding protein